MASSPIKLTIKFGTSSSYTLATTTDSENIVALSTSLSEIKERITSIEDLAQSYPVERQRLYYCVDNDTKGRYYLPDDNRTLLSYGIDGDDVTLYLGRSNQRRRFNTSNATTTTTSLSTSRDERITPQQQLKEALLSICLADEIWTSIKKSQEEIITLAREIIDFEQLKIDITSSPQELNDNDIINDNGNIFHKINDEIDKILIRLPDEKHLCTKLKLKKIRVMNNLVEQDLTLVERVLAMSNESCSEYLLNKLHHYAPYSTLSDITNQSCIICNIDFCPHKIKLSITKAVMKTSCNHIFHRECLKKWMLISNKLSCPLCRGRICDFRSF